MTCKDCQHKKVIRRFGNTTAEVYCEHPDKQYIRDYYAENRINRAEGFIGFINSKGDFPIKKSPKWCPLKVERSEGK